MKQLFTDAGVWSGGFYELVFKVPDPSQKGARKAVIALWKDPAIEGCFLERDREPVQQVRISSAEIPLQSHSYGIATLSNGNVCVCGSFWGTYGEKGSWVTLYLPLGSLGKAYPTGAYPFNRKGEPSSGTWLREINLWLKNIAEAVYEQAPFKVAMIGYEVDFLEVKEQMLTAVPEKRWEGILVPKGDELLWYPPNVYVPPLTMERVLK